MMLDAGARPAKYNPFRLSDHWQGPATYPWHESQVVEKPDGKIDVRQWTDRKAFRCREPVPNMIEK